MTTTVKTVASVLKAQAKVMAQATVIVAANIMATTETRVAKTVVRVRALVRKMMFHKRVQILDLQNLVMNAQRLKASQLQLSLTLKLLNQKTALTAAVTSKKVRKIKRAPLVAELSLLKTQRR